VGCKRLALRLRENVDGQVHSRRVNLNLRCDHRDWEEQLSELDEAWAIGLAEAEARAREQGRADISAYLALRSSNDLIRKIAADWLLNIFATFAGAANRAGGAIQVLREEAHRFKDGNATMVGPRLSLTSGVRLLQVEVGWPRTPRDGIIRGGGLACGHLKHVGIRSANEELRLILNDVGTPSWIIIDRHGSLGESRELHEQDVKAHVNILLNDSRNSR